VAKDNGIDNKMTSEEWGNFVVEYIMEIHKIFNYKISPFF